MLAHLPPHSSSVIVSKMKKAHLKYLLIGIIFWGVVIGLIVKFIYYQDISFLKLLLIYSAATLFITLLVQFYMGGFLFKDPKRWFYLPLICWVIVIVWGNIEIMMTGGEPFFIHFLQ